MVERDMFQPDMATIEVVNQGNEYNNKVKFGDSVEIKTGGSGSNSISVFKGEVTGLLPNYSGKKETTIRIRALSKFAKMLRGRKSKTFQNMNDSDILGKIISEAGLTMQFEGPSITYKHVYQHNQSDLEFLRVRAARIGCHVWCVDKTVFVKLPKFTDDVGVELAVDNAPKGESIEVFLPILDASAVLKKMTVRGWDPETKKELVGVAEAKPSQLGSLLAHAASSDLGAIEDFNVDQPIWSAQEAKVLAEALLMDRNLNYITGTVQLAGNPTMELGKVVKITVDSNNATDRFNGKYYIMGLSHRMSTSTANGGGRYLTTLRVARDAEKP
ncbi:MAG: phage late control D family protein [Deltaproteobacteria bacterium]|nr:phage late control D family protein [Deltaproteobacteria bacterium]